MSNEITNKTEICFRTFDYGLKVKILLCQIKNLELLRVKTRHQKRKLGLYITMSQPNKADFD